MMHLGGAPARVAPTLNAVAFRSAQYVLNITAAWEASHEDQQHIGWAREFWGAAHPLSTGIGYTNFMTEDEVTHACAPPTERSCMRDCARRKMMAPAARFFCSLIFLGFGARV